MGRITNQGSSLRKQALESYKLGNFAKCELFLEKAIDMGDELSIVLLARLYYEMGSPMRASALLRRNGYDEEALLFESLCQEGKLIISNALERGDAKKVEDGFLFESGISLEGRAILPLNRRMRGKLLEDFDGLLEQTFLNYLKDMEL